MNYSVTCNFKQCVSTKLLVVRSPNGGYNSVLILTVHHNLDQAFPILVCSEDYGYIYLHIHVQTVPVLVLCQQHWELQQM